MQAVGLELLGGILGYMRASRGYLGRLLVDIKRRMSELGCISKACVPGA